MRPKDNNSNARVRIFDYNELAAAKDEVITQFHDEGFIAVRNVPEFVQAYDAFLQETQKFTQLSEAQKAKCQPDDKYKRGWSYGIESLKGVKDSFKGSYFALIPNVDSNIWPNEDVPNFKQAYLKLADVIYKAGEEVLPLIDINLDKLHSKGRMLYYGPVSKASDDSSPDWCSEHRDHGLFTCLCPAVYIKKGQVVERQEGSGLFIRGKAVSIPNDAVIFQIGETAELISNGKLTATEHLVKKSYGEEKRFTFALFIDPEEDHVINSTVTKYNDRFHNGITYGQLAQASYAKYNETS